MLASALAQTARADASGADSLAEWSAVTSRLVDGSGRCFTGSVERAEVLVAMAEAVGAAAGAPALWLERTPAEAAGSSQTAALAAAAHDVLAVLRPDARDALDAALARSLAMERAADPRDAGVTAGRAAAEMVLQKRARRAAKLREWMPPAFAPGTFRSSDAPLGVNCGEETPWFLTRADALRPRPPPALDSPAFAEDIAESRARGGSESRVRTAAETASAQFWAGAGAAIWMPILVRLSAQPGRTLLENVRLWALLAAAAADTEIAVFDAKYAYLFWRPETALAAAKWRPLLPTPNHPEFPCAHCAMTAAFVSVLTAEFGDAPPGGIWLPAPEGPRHYARLSEVVAEVQQARIDAGAHFRTSARVGAAMGRAIAGVVTERAP